MSRLKLVRPEATTNLCTNPSVEKDLAGWASVGLSSFVRSAAWQARGAWSARGIADSIGDKIQAPLFTLADDYAAQAQASVVSGTWRATVSDGFHRPEVAGLTAGEHDIELLGRRYPAMAEIPGTANNFWSTPDHAALDLTGAFELRIALVFDAVPVATWHLIGKDDVATNRSYALQIPASNVLRALWSANGSSGNNEDSTIVLPITVGVLMLLRLRFEPSVGGNRVVKFFTMKPTVANPLDQLRLLVGWEQLGTTKTNVPTSIFSGNAPLTIGAQSTGAGPSNIKCMAALVLNGVDAAGVEVANPDFTSRPPGVGAFTDAAGRVWTPQGTASIADLDATTRRLELECTTATGTAYVDAVQYEAKDYATTYCDGDQDGCRWAGVPHASTSSRDAAESSGGRAIDIFDDASIGLLYSDLAGVGVPPLQHVTQELALRDGAILQRVKAAPAVVTISATQRAASLPALHALRRALVDLLRPQSGSSPRPTRLVYSGSGDPMHLDVHYLAGLEGQIRRPSRFERPNVQLVAYDPHWKEANDVGASLATSLAVSANRIIARRDGVWQALGTGADNAIDTIALGTDGKVYVGGIFLNIGGVAANRVAYWDPADNAWHAMGAGLDVRPTWLTRGPDGRIYAVGNFTTPATRVAVWDPVALTWSALGTGLNAEGTFAVWGPDGYMYVGGFFTSAGGVAVAGGIARWNGAAWSQVPGNPDLYSGTNQGPYAIVVLPNGKIYVGGLFNIGSGAGFDYMAHYNGVAWSQVAGATSYPAVMTLGPDGNIYVGGGFTSPTLRIARFSGLQFFGLGAGLNAQPKAIAFDETGELYAGGEFTAAGSLSLSDRIARWNGSVWRPLPVDLPGTGAFVDEIAIHGEDIYVVGAFSGNALAPGRTTVTNPGSADAYPLIRLTGPATLRSIENVTTGQEILFDAYVLQAGEQVVVDLRPGRKSVVSSFRGNVLGEVLAGSDLATFALVPGDNDIGVLASGGTADLFFRPRHWGGE